MKNIFNNIKIEEIKPVEFSLVLQVLKNKGIVINKFIINTAKFFEILGHYRISPKEFLNKYNLI